MSELLDLLQRISEGSPAPLGFGAARASNLPGLALVGLAASGDQAALDAAAQGSLDAVLTTEAAGIKSLADSAGATPWGLSAAQMSAEDAKAGADAGADLLAFGLESPAATVVGDYELARMLAIPPDLGDRQFRAVASLPVDGFTLDMTSVSGPWTLQEVVAVGGVTRRTDKYVLVQVSAVPAMEDLTALRDMGASGIIVDLAGKTAEDLAALKSALLEMPRQRRRRDRRRSVAAGAVFSLSSAPAQEDDGGHEDDYDDDE